MSFFITTLDLDGKLIEINSAERAEIIGARDSLVEMLAIEECMSLVARAYADFEKSVLSHSFDLISYSRRSSFMDESLMEVREDINFRSFSFLMAGKSYSDHCSKRVSRIGEIRSTKISSKSIFRAAYDRSFEYRIVENLRNIAAHSSLPVANITYGFKRQFESARDMDGRSRLRNNIAPYIKSSALEINEKVQPRVRREVLELNKKYLDMRYIFRGYISQVVQVHTEIRQLLSGQQGACKAILQDILSKIITESGDSDPSNIILTSDRSPISEDAINIDIRRFTLLNYEDERWSRLKSAQSQYVSSGIIRNRDCWPDGLEDDVTLYVEP